MTRAGRAMLSIDVTSQQTPDFPARAGTVVVRGSAALRAALQPVMLCFAAGVGLLSPCPAVAQQWIDVHAHLVGGRSGFLGAPEAAIEAMNRAGIKKSVLMPTPQDDGRYDYDVLASAAKSNPQRFAFLGGGGSLNPMIQRHGDPAQVTDNVKRRFEAKAEEIIAAGAAGFGEITALHPSVAPGHPFESVPADHPLLLLLADIAARHGVPIDLHMDLVVAETPPRGPQANAANPPLFKPNLDAFERLLAHNRQARIVWAHAGSDFVGHWTVQRSRQLLQQHSNLYMSLRLGGGIPLNRPLTYGGELKSEWRALFDEFPDRFMLGTDSFHMGAGASGKGPGAMFSERNEPRLENSRRLLSQLPPELAVKIGRDNALAIYRLKD